MIDPVIFSFNIFGLTLALRWYGVLIMSAVLLGAWITSRQLARRGENPELVWDALLVVLVSGVIGARAWFVLNATLGGSRYYLDNPLKILAITEGGLHIFGAFLLGGLAAYLYARAKQLDILLLLDSAAPALLLGQAAARPANFINQELYGPPTDLPWGIPISAPHRLPPWNDLAQYPLETTRFHPTFAYEMLWNILAGGLLLWLARRYPQKLKPGALFAAWLVLAGLGRVLIETFRPDQPRLPGTGLSYSRLVSLLMAVAGLLWLLVRYGYLSIPGLRLPERYRLSPPAGQRKAAAGKP
ncbi:MAG: prolipoprotein diacylglyceryl transferase [Chloroflexota bacterium]